MSGPLGSSQFMYSSGSASSFYDFHVPFSARFEHGNDTTLNRTTSFSAVTTFTFSTWLKRGKLGANLGGEYAFVLKCDSNKGIGFTDNDYLTVLNGSSHATGGNEYYRDTSGWYHMVLKVSSGTGYGYINGELQHSNTGMELQGAADAETIGIGQYGTNNFDGYLAETVLIDGTAYNPTTFAESKQGVWVPKDFKDDVTFGTHGVYLKYADASNLGLDSSGNGNNYTGTNMGSDHQSIESPTTEFN